MGLFDSLFGRSKPQSQPQSQPQYTSAPAAPNIGDEVTLPYDPDLIPRMIDEHRALLSLFGGIERAQQSADFQAVKTALQKFQLSLNLHLATENARFYAYLRRHLRTNTDEHQTMTAFWDEMQEIGKVVTQFLRKYNYADFTADMQASFASELKQIGAALVARIKREEESLYGLYMPSYARR